jgi:hypothetical protein
MKLNPVVSAFVVYFAVGFVSMLSSQDAPKKPQTNPKHPSGAVVTKGFQPRTGTLDFTLQRVRDFHYSGGDVDCPNCKDMFTARIAPPVAGTVITSVTVIARRPTSNNHWFRCQVEARCGRPEFSDPNDARLDCIGKTVCDVNRATDDGVPGYEDDIRMTYK